MFLGTHSPRLDDKGRMFLPAKYREDLAVHTGATIGASHKTPGSTSSDAAENASSWSAR